jgi:tetratricopeptide (TPR) repeat protein
MELTITCFMIPQTAQVRFLYSFVPLRLISVPGTPSDMEFDAWTISGSRSRSPLPNNEEPEISPPISQDRHGGLDFLPGSTYLRDADIPVVDSDYSGLLFELETVATVHECSIPSSFDGISTPISSKEDRTSSTRSQSASFLDEIFVSATDLTDISLSTTEQSLNTNYYDQFTAHAHAIQSDNQTMNGHSHSLCVTSDALTDSSKFGDGGQSVKSRIWNVPIRTVSCIMLEKDFSIEEERPEQVLSQDSVSEEVWTKHTDTETLRLRLQLSAIQFSYHNPNVFNLQMQFGAMLIEVGRYKDAENELDKAVRRIERLYGANDDRTMEALMQLGIASLGNGNPRRAEYIFEDVVSFRIRAFGREHPKTLSSLRSKALALSDQARWDEAEILEKEIMHTSLQSSLLGPIHRDTLAIRNRVVVSHLQRGRLREAADMCEELMKDCTESLGETDPTTLVSRSNFASAMSGLGSLEYAARLESDLLEISKQKFGLEHPDTLNKMLNLAMTYLDLSERNESTSSIRAMRQLKQSAVIMEEVVERQTEVRGGLHMDTLASIHCLVLVRLGQGRFAEGEEMGRNLVKDCKKAPSLGVDHPTTLHCMDTYSQILAKQKRFPEAIRVMKECVLLSRRKLGREHPDTLDSVEALAELRRQMRTLRT